MSKETIHQFTTTVLFLLLTYFVMWTAILSHVNYDLNRKAASDKVYREYASQKLTEKDSSEVYYEELPNKMLGRCKFDNND